MTDAEAPSFSHVKICNVLGPVNFDGLLTLARQEAIAPFHQVVTLSAGYHAQGLAPASRLFGDSAHFVMPEPVKVRKRARVEEWGAKVTVVPSRPEGQAVAQELVW